MGLIRVVIPPFASIVLGTAKVEDFDWKPPKPVATINHPEFRQIEPDDRITCVVHKKEVIGTVKRKIGNNTLVLLFDGKPSEVRFRFSKNRILQIVRRFDIKKPSRSSHR